MKLMMTLVCYNLLLFSILFLRFPVHFYCINLVTETFSVLANPGFSGGMNPMDFGGMGGMGGMGGDESDSDDDGELIVLAQTQMILSSDNFVVVFFFFNRAWRRRCPSR